MSITVVKDKGATVITVSSDSKSMFPPLCQILKALCYSLKCCSVYKWLMQTNVKVLGTLEIMLGLLNIVLWMGRINEYPEYSTDLGTGFLFGGSFIIAGVMSILAGRFPSLGLVDFALFMHLVGVIFGFVGMLLYARDMADAFLQDV